MVRGIYFQKHPLIIFKKDLDFSKNIPTFATRNKEIEFVKY